MLSQNNNNFHDLYETSYDTTMAAPKKRKLLSNF